MLKPRALRTGDRIAVIAPASPFAREEFDEGIAELRRLGFDPVYDKRVLARAYLAGEASLRAAAFIEAWRDPGIAGIGVATRGGYRNVHILQGMTVDLLRATPKAFVGYSDLTSLLSYLSTVCGIVCFHGPMLAGRLHEVTTGMTAARSCGA